MISELKIIKCLCDECKLNKTSMIDVDIEISNNLDLLPLYWKRIDNRDLCHNCVKQIEKLKSETISKEDQINEIGD